MGSIRPRWRPFAAALIAVLMGVSVLLPVRAMAQDSPVQEATALYEQAQFNEAITLLRGALSSGLVRGRDAVAAREMIARCLVRTGSRIEAKEAFKGMLQLNPNYRPATGTMPPDEFGIYQMALDEFKGDQIVAGERVPASVAIHFGVGSGDNKDLAEVAVAGGGMDTYDVDPTFGGAVRFPITQRMSLEIEMQRFRATNADTFPGTSQAVYEITALPLSLSLYYAAMTNPKWRVNVFGGVGSMLAATSSIRFDFGSATLNLSDQKNGFYGHAGLEGEFLVHPRVSAYGRVLGRIANASGIYSDTDLEAYGTAQIKDREVNFNGFGANVGLRAYIGY
jgi:hypothetical protein